MSNARRIRMLQRWEPNRNLSKIFVNGIKLGTVLMFFSHIFFVDIKDEA
jgi:hypothetical protein